LLRDPALARQMARTGRRRIESEFSSLRMAGRYEDLYRRCLISRGHAALATFA
jgi:glycosyltransferase involved in cell wall biosynthesis